MRPTLEVKLGRKILLIGNFILTSSGVTLEGAVSEEEQSLNPWFLLLRQRPQSNDLGHCQRKQKPRAE